MDTDFDVICIGAGPAGEALTTELSGSGLSLAVIEKALVGGECAYYGCIPSKTLLRSAEVLTEAGRARQLSASRVEWDVDFRKVRDRVVYMTRGLDDSSAARAIEASGGRLFRGEGRLVGPLAVTVDDTRLTARKAVVIATGTAPAIPPIPGLQSVPYWTNREAVQAERLPASIIVIGSGAAGVELAQAFARLGTKVLIVEAGDRVLSVEEPEAGDFLKGRLEVEGIGIVTSASIERVEPHTPGVRVHLKSGSPLTAERLLVAAGRRPNTQGIDAPSAGLTKTPRGMIQVDPATLQAAPGIYAVGDVNGLGGFTHLSHYHGTLVAQALRGESVRADHAAVPRVTFTDPEIASVGITERQARDRGITVETLSHDVAQTGRGYIHGEPGGLIKLIADTDRKLLVGATIVSPRGGEMLSELTLAVKLRLPLATLSDTVHPFPTFSRVFQGLFAELVKKTSARQGVPA